MVNTFETDRSLHPWLLIPSYEDRKGKTEGGGKKLDPNQVLAILKAHKEFEDVAGPYDDLLKAVRTHNNLTDEVWNQMPVTVEAMLNGRSKKGTDRLSDVEMPTQEGYVNNFGSILADACGIELERWEAMTFDKKMKMIEKTECLPYQIVAKNLRANLATWTADLNRKLEL